MKYIITGASSGLGFCIAKRLIIHGQVLGISRTTGKSNLLLESGMFKYIRYDLSKTSNKKSYAILIKQILEFIEDEPFTLILNAANFYYGNKRLSHLKLNTLFQVNVFSIMNIIRDMKEYDLRRVFIINSVSGLAGQKNQHEYSASKHAVLGYSRSLAKSAKHDNFDVISINPGGMKTELWEDIDKVNTLDFLSPEIVADICMNLILIKGRIFIDTMSLLPPSDV